MGQEADCGYLIDRSEVDIKENDTFHSIATRQYELEVTMLMEALKKEICKNISLQPIGKVTKRMPAKIEESLMKKVEKLTSNKKVITY